MIKLEQLKVGSILIARNTKNKSKVLGTCGLVIFISADGAYNEHSGTLTIEEINLIYTLDTPRMPKKGEVIVIDNDKVRIATGAYNGNNARFYMNGNIENKDGITGTSQWEFYDPEKHCK